MTQDPTHASGEWLNHWLETQRAWLSRWQESVAQQQAPDFDFPDLDLKGQFDSQAMAAQVMNAAQGFQSLLQSSFGQFSNDTSAASHSLWQQVQQAFALGPAREHQLAWQEYVSAASEYHTRQQTVFDAYAKVFTASLEAVRTVAEQRNAQGQAVNGLRELYELWIDCGERNFAQLARDQSFMTAQATSANALSRLKLARNVLLDQWLKLHDLPTRSEINSVHLRLRELSARVAQLEQLTVLKPKPKAPKKTPRAGKPT